MNEPFRITISQIEFDKLRNDKKFILILKLARIHNSMRCSWSITVKSINEDTPSSRRDLFTSFAYMCALLYESFQSTRNKKCIYDELNEEFSSFKPFEKLQELKNDNDRIRYHEILGKIRDKIAFHFDTDVIAESLESYETNTDEVILLESHTRHTGDVDYPLADKLVYHYLQNTCQLNNESTKDFVNKVAAFSKKFIDSSEILMAELFCKFKVNIKS